MLQVSMGVFGINIQQALYPRSMGVDGCHDGHMVAEPRQRGHEAVPRHPRPGPRLLRPHQHAVYPPHPAPPAASGAFAIDKEKIEEMFAFAPKKCCCGCG